MNPEWLKFWLKVWLSGPIASVFLCRAPYKGTTNLANAALTLFIESGFVETEAEARTLKTINTGACCSYIVALRRIYRRIVEAL